MQVLKTCKVYRIMKALTFHGKETIKYESVPEPEIEQPTDVIVKVHVAENLKKDPRVKNIY